MDFDDLIELREHCSILSHFLAVLDQLRPEQITTRDAEVLSWLTASEWLDIAASIDRVEVNTSRFDDSVQFCRPAWEYQSERSNLMTRFTTELTAFNFIWGGFETVIQLINPRKVPKGLKQNGSKIDNAIYFLKNEYEPTPLIDSFKESLGTLSSILSALPYYGNLANEFRLQPYIGLSGIGINVVRRIRNKFAHGTMTLPEPEDWSDNKPLDTQLITLSSRIALFTIQMLLYAYFKDDDFEVDCLKGNEGFPVDEQAGAALRKLHLQPSFVSENQLILFPGENQV